MAEAEAVIWPASGRPSRRGVSRNKNQTGINIFGSSRPSRRGVSRNFEADEAADKGFQSPLPQGRE